MQVICPDLCRGTLKRDIYLRMRPEFSLDHMPRWIGLRSGDSLEDARMVATFWRIPVLFLTLSLSFRHTLQHLPPSISDQESQ